MQRPALFIAHTTWLLVWHCRLHWFYEGLNATWDIFILNKSHTVNYSMSVSTPWTAAERLAIQGSGKAGISIEPQDCRAVCQRGRRSRRNISTGKHPPFFFFNMYEEPGEGHHFVKVTSILLTNGSWSCHCLAKTWFKELRSPAIFRKQEWSHSANYEPVSKLKFCLFLWLRLEGGWVWAAGSAMDTTQGKETRRQEARPLWYALLWP